MTDKTCKACDQKFSHTPVNKEFCSCQCVVNWHLEQDSKAEYPTVQDFVDEMVEGYLSG